LDKPSKIVTDLLKKHKFEYRFANVFYGPDSIMEVHSSKSGRPIYFVHRTMVGRTMIQNGVRISSLKAYLEKLDAQQI